MPVSPSHIAVLGGGITGLSSAFHLSRRFPATRISLIEQSFRLGGWLKSERVSLQYEGRQNDTSNTSPHADLGRTVLLEAGPRTLRPNYDAILELITLLNLESQLVTIPKTSPLARRRYLYIPDQDTGDGGLTSLPSSLLETFTSPIGRMLAWSVIREALRPANFPASGSSSASEEYLDESIHDFFTRRFGPEIALTMGSALTHGIYASDSRKVSIRAAFPRLWDMAAQGYGSVTRGMVLNALGLSRLPKREAGVDYQISNEVRRLMKGTSVFTFRDGMQSLSGALEKHLHHANNVDVHLGRSIQDIKLNDQSKDPTVSIHTTGGCIPDISHVVFSLPLLQVQRLLPALPNPSILSDQLVSNQVQDPDVTVVNLVFPSPSSSDSQHHGLHPPGFGYLIPRPSSPSTSANEPQILGVVFDTPQTDTPVNESQVASASGTQPVKMTVMVSGAHPELDIKWLVGRISHHLGHGRSAPSSHGLPEPLLYKVHVNKACIPAPRVGHLARVKEMRHVLAHGILNSSPSGHHSSLSSDMRKSVDILEAMKGRVSVIGAGVDGVSVGDCIEAGRNAGANWTF